MTSYYRFSKPKIDPYNPTKVGIYISSPSRGWWYYFKEGDIVTFDMGGRTWTSPVITHNAKPCVKLGKKFMALVNVEISSYTTKSNI